ncbi:MAG TPA: hypothetical protein VFV48_06040, partial [Pseudomonadales bacterium]|nr:hypothetical protein [Pseudomonadales bacterium]
MANIVGTIKSAMGEVMVTRASGEVVAVMEGDTINPGDVITTGAEGTALIEFPAVEGKTATEGILKPNSSATLKDVDGAGQFEVAQGEFEVTSEGENQSVAVVGGGMFGLFGGALAAGASAGPLGLAAGAAFVLASNGDDEEASGSGSGNG